MTQVKHFNVEAMPNKAKKQTVFGTFKYNDLIADGVINEQLTQKLKFNEDILMKNLNDAPIIGTYKNLIKGDKSQAQKIILSNTILVFNTNNAGGFRINSIFRQKSKSMICGAPATKEAVLSSFEITSADIVSLRHSLFQRAMSKASK